MTERRRLYLAPLSVLAAAILLTVSAALPVRAEAGDPFVVEVPVDVEAESASAAREAAMRRGEQQAFRKLLERLTLPADHARLPQVDAAQVANLVQSVQLANERTSDVRYIADMTVRFQPDGVRRILDSANINYVDAPSRPVVVLPVWLEEGRPTLWDDPNPWREAWDRAVPPGGLVPVIVPIGDLEDLRAIDAGQAQQANAEAMADIGARYSAGAVLVAVADPGAGSVTLNRFDVTTREASSAGSQALPDAESGEGLAPAVRSIVEELEARWKQANVVSSGTAQELQVRVPLTTFDTWVTVRSRLDRINMIKTTDVRSLTRTQAHLRLNYVGDVERLRAALLQHQLVLAPDDFGGGAGESWMLHLAPSVQPGQQSPSGPEAEPQPNGGSQGGAAGPGPAPQG